MFISCSSLWSNLACADEDKTRVYLERSRSSPINLLLWRRFDVPPLDPFLQIIPQAIGRLKSLFVKVKPEELQAIAGHLSHSAPLLERLDVDGAFQILSGRRCVLPSTIFGGDLSSLRELNLDTVLTELPWRNMANLTSFTWRSNLVDDFTIGQLLDFLETAPRLRKIYFNFATLVSGGENGRLISLDHLERMGVIECGPTSILFDHLVIPVGAKLKIQHSVIEDQIPRLLENLKNLSDFTEVHICDNVRPHLRLRGPNGRALMDVGAIDVDTTNLFFESLARFDASKTEQLKIDSCIFPSGDILHRTLLPLENLRTLILVQRGDLCLLVDTLNPNKSRSRKVVCPSLEEFIFKFYPNKVETRGVMKMAAARASRGAKLRTVVAVGDEDELDLADVSKFRKRGLHEEWDLEIDDESDDDSEEDYCGRFWR